MDVNDQQYYQGVIQIILFAMLDDGPPTFPAPTCQSTSTFGISDTLSIVISSEFDSGNIQVLKQISEFEYRLSAVTDNQNSQFRMNSKSWFYFSVEAQVGVKLSFTIEKVQCLFQILDGKFGNVYRPVVKENGVWKRLGTECRLTLKCEDIVQISFDYSFQTSSKAYFAFCYPFSYQENLDYLSTLNQHLTNQKFYYNKQLLIHSPERRQVHLLTITSNHQDTEQLEPVFNPNLFPQLNRSKKFNKPVVLITARVHPGESSASYSMIGIIDFLTSDDLRAVILREMFVFMIVPMINVDGVYRGNFRMDLYGKNLNRYYLDPDIEKQPAPYAIKKLSEYLNDNKRLSFYFDLHAHNSKKGCFIYGNAIDDFVDQVQSNTFCKIVSLNTKFFEYEECTFSLKHMRVKDRYDQITKEGCARVVMHKTAGIIHSYSLECGLISSNTLNYLPDPPNKAFTHAQYGLIEDEMENNENPLFEAESPLYTQEMYQNVGKALMVSILDTFDKNPYSRVLSSNFSSLSNLRRTIAAQIFHEAERFRMFQRHIYVKVKRIGELMNQNFKEKFNSSLFNIQHSLAFKDVTWPQNILGLQKEQKKKNFSLEKPFRISLKSQSDQPLEQPFCTKPLYESYCEELSSTAIESNIDAEPLDYNPEEFRFSPYPHYLKLPSLPQKARQSPTLPISTLTFESKQIDLKNKIKNSIKKQLKIQLYDQLYPFGDRTLRLQGTNSKDMPSNLIFVKNRSKSNTTAMGKEKRVVIQRNSKLKAVSKREQHEFKIQNNSLSFSQHTDSLSLKLEESITSIEKPLKQRENYLQLSISESGISPTNKEKYSQIKLMFPASVRREARNDLKLPRIVGGEKDWSTNQQGDLNTVELDLIDKEIEYRSEQVSKEVESKMKMNIKVFNRLRKVKK